MDMSDNLAVEATDELEQEREQLRAGTSEPAAFGFSGLALGHRLVLMFGAGTDYCLLLVSRYRSALRQHPEAVDALRAAIPEAAAGASKTLPPDLMLIEGWATAAAHRLACALAVDGEIAPDRLFAAGRFPAARRGWLVNLLVALEKSGLVRSDGELFALVDGFPLPAPNDILRSIAADYPSRSTELLLAAHASAVMEALYKAAKQQSWVTPTRNN